MNAGLLIIILLLGLALLGFPIYIALGIGALAALNLADLPLIVLPQRMFAGMNGSALLAIPFFILAGNIMSRSITGKLIDICNAIIGHIKGSLSLVTILASALFGAISGSGVATASAIGGITIPAMKREGYPAPLRRGRSVHLLHPGSHHSALHCADRVRQHHQCVRGGAVPGLRIAGHHSGGGSDCLRPVLRPQAQSAGP